MFSGGSSETTGAPACKRLARPRQHVGDESGDRRGDRALGEAPARLRQSRVGGLDRRGLGDDLVRPAERRLSLLHRGCGGGDFRLGRGEVGPLLVDDLLGRRAARQQGLVALEVGLHLAARGDRVVEIGLGLGDLGRLGGSLQIGELVLGLLRQVRGLIDRGAVHRVVLVEQRRALDDTVAALDVDGGDEALLGRPDLDEIGFGVALPRRLGRRLSEPEDGESSGDRNDDAHHYDRSLCPRSIPQICNETVALHYRTKLC